MFGVRSSDLLFVLLPRIDSIERVDRNGCILSKMFMAKKRPLRVLLLRGLSVGFACDTKIVLRLPDRGPSRKKNLLKQLHPWRVHNRGGEGFMSTTYARIK